MKAFKRSHFKYAAVYSGSAMKSVHIPEKQDKQQQVYF